MASLPTQTTPILNNIRGTPTASAEDMPRTKLVTAASHSKAVYTLYNNTTTS
jgi:hypothetical protein